MTSNPFLWKHVLSWLTFDSARVIKVCRNQNHIFPQSWSRSSLNRLTALRDDKLSHTSLCHCTVWIIYTCNEFVVTLISNCQSYSKKVFFSVVSEWHIKDCWPKETYLQAVAGKAQISTSFFFFYEIATIVFALSLVDRCVFNES